MALMAAKKIEQIAQASDARKAILEAVGDLSVIEVLSDLVLVGTYIRPERTAGGIIRPTDNIKEDEYQGKVGLVLKKGPLAYGDWEDGEEIGANAQIGTWVVYAIKDGWPVTLNGTPCRVLPYEKIRMRTTDPTIVF